MRQLALASLLSLGTLPICAQRRPPLLAAPLPSPKVEDAVTSRLNDLRAGAHLRRLVRIQNRRALRQIVCTAAVTGLPQQTLLTREAQADSTVFAVRDLAHLPDDLARVAAYDDRGSANNRRATRFAVAAFPGEANSSLTWVGVALYWSPLTEFFALHLTRAYSPPDLTDSIAPVCRGLR